MASEQQPRRTSSHDPNKEELEEGDIRYGDVFPAVAAASRELASRAIPPGDAALMQYAEAQIQGKTQRGGPAAGEGAIRHGYQPERWRSWSWRGDRVALQLNMTLGLLKLMFREGGLWPRPSEDSWTVTIGDALEATAITIGNKPIDQCDADAIQAAEIRAAHGRAWKFFGPRAT
ncbi:hypothetical protein Scep_009579 [Stephania cephalantha]|uniref:SMP domain-containing protein n=1 Tax=Stephania cephalantha TaxID=152367 RepID=A0AAP0PCM8_9MAGN